MFRNTLLAIGAAAFITGGTPSRANAASCGNTNGDGDCWIRPQWACIVGIIIMEGYCDRDLVPDCCPFGC